MLLSLPAAAAAACCSSVLLLYHCSVAQVQLVWLCNHWVRLHCCTLPVLLLKLLLTLSFSSVACLGLKSSNFLSGVSMAWVPWLGYLDWKYLEYSINSANCPVSPIVHIFPLSLKKYCRKVQGIKIIRITIEVFGDRFVIVKKFSGVQVSKCSFGRIHTTILVIIVEIHKSIKQLSKHKVQ